ncbi:MAG: hypothetical protein JW908_12250 [Anaerolineales bacterium]|nr:hypothetical protein [Anaerolineales bacterium]
MTSNSFDPESEALYRIIRGESNQDIPMSNSEDAEFAASIRKTAQKIHANPLFQADLELRLRKISPAPQKSTKLTLFSFTKNLAWIAAVLVIVLVAIWSIRTLLPQPLAIPTPTIFASASETPALTPTPLATIIAGTPAAESTPQGEFYKSAILPDDFIILNAEFPTSPSEIKVYIQNINENLTFEYGLALATQLGFDGKIYNVEKDGDQITSYYVTDNISRLLIFSTTHFYYVPNYQNSRQVSNQKYPTTDEQISIAEKFLKEHSLINFPYRIQTEEFIPGKISFIQLLDDRSITYGLLGSAEIAVEMDENNSIKSINYEVHNFTEAGAYPIISAEEAWQKIQSSENLEGLESNSTFYSPKVNEIWWREYPLGERVDLFGYLEILKPANASETPLLFLNYYLLQGDIQALHQSANPGKFMQIWGQFQTDDKGNRFFQVEGWQLSPFEHLTVQGVIQRQGDQGYMTVNNKQWLIPDLPESAPGDQEVYVNGIALESESTIEWWMISISYGGGGGGGGGSGFTSLNLEQAPTPVPVPTETPMPIPQTSYRFNGVQGNPYITFFKDENGVSTISAYMNLKPSAEWQGGLSLTLKGDGLEGIEAYHQLPVKIWGSVISASQSQVVVEVERYEPVYPDIKPQAWLGTIEQVSLGEIPVLMLTDQSGEKYILNISLESEGKTPPIETPYIVEGVIYPDEFYKGYPVIHDFTMFGAQGIENLDDYQPRSLSPMTLDSVNQHLGNEILTIEKIELVYYTGDVTTILPDGSMPPTYAEPAWRFYGHYANGDIFEILVQALSDEYLQ